MIIKTMKPQSTYVEAEGVKLSVDLHVKSDSETLTVITNRLQLAR